MLLGALARDRMVWSSCKTGLSAQDPTEVSMNLCRVSTSPLLSSPLPPVNHRHPGGCHRASAALSCPVQCPMSQGDRSTAAVRNDFVSRAHRCCSQFYAPR